MGNFVCPEPSARSSSKSITTVSLPIVIVLIANHDNNQHASDENIRIGNIWYGTEIYSSIFTS
jgi:hypothetical protein